MVDKNEAPEGYEAVGENENVDGLCCAHCVFNGDDCSEHNVGGKGISCEAEARKDGEEVYFVKKSKEINMKFDEHRVCSIWDASILRVGDKVLSANSISSLHALLQCLGNGVKPEILIGINTEKGFQTDYEGVVCNSSDYYNYVYLLESMNQDELSISGYKRMKAIIEANISRLITEFELKTHVDVKGVTLGKFDCEEGQHVKLEAEFWD